MASMSVAARLKPSVCGDVFITAGGVLDTEVSAPQCSGAMPTISGSKPGVNSRAACLVTSQPLVADLVQFKIEHDTDPVPHREALLLIPAVVNALLSRGRAL
jgi:hypothetical protein